MKPGDKIPIVKCSHCQKSFVPRFTERQREPDLFEIGLECPHCEVWVHSYFLNKNLKKRQRVIQERRLPVAKRKRYQQDFVKFNEATRKHLGMKVKTAGVL